VGRIAEKEGWLMNSTCWPLFFVIGLWRLLYCPKLWRDALWLLNVVHYTSNCLRHFIIFLHLQRSMASSLFILCAWRSSRTTSLQVLFGSPHGLGLSTSYSIHFFTQSSSSFRSTCPYQRSLFCCNTNAMSSIPSLCLNSLLGSLSFDYGSVYWQSWSQYLVYNI